MDFKRSMLILIAAIFLVSIASVCASEANDTAIASEDTDFKLSADNEMDADNLQTNDETPTLAVGDNDETLSAKTNSEIITEGQYTYSDLREQIGTGGNKNLTKGTYTYNQNDGNTIEITDSGVIDGNGAVIDMVGSNIRAFYVSASDVTIRNLTIKNAYFDGDGGAIYFGGTGTVENCTFIGNNAFMGGAIRGGSAVNCIFTGNDAFGGGAIRGGSAVNCTFSGNVASSLGGAMFEGSAVNCTFSGNFASSQGGAMYDGSAVNCTFSGNTANQGGAMYDGSAVNCTFSGNTANELGGAMFEGSAVLCIFETSSDTFYNTNINIPTFTVSKHYFIFDHGDRLLFNLTYDNKNYDGYNTTITLTKDGNPVGVYYALSGSDEGWYADLSPGTYRATLSMEQYAVNPITVDIITGNVDTTYFGLMDEIGDGGNINLTESYYNYIGGHTIEIKNSGVINGNGAVIDMAGSNIRAFYVSASDVTIRNLTIKNAYFDGDGGAIYFGGTGTVENCTFIGNKANGGGAMYEGYAINCRFIENHANNGCGGAINGYNHKSVNCTFTSNSANEMGGALSGGEAHNCTFISNVANNGGAINNGKAYTCNFTGNHANENGGAMYGGTAVLCIFETSSDTFYNTNINIPTFTVSKHYFIFDHGDRLLFNLTYDNKNYDGYNTTITLTKDGNPVGVYYALSGSDEGWSVNLNPGVYYATLSMDKYRAKPITLTILTGIKVSTYSGLSGEICSGGNIKLKHDYYTYDSGNTIKITKSNTVIDGNGAIIDMLGSSDKQAFEVTASEVTIKNLTIKNANYNGDGGAIYFSSSGTVTNCNFTDNKASRDGGAIYFKGSGTVTNCNFTDNKATGDDSYGGAIRVNGEGTVTNCNFTDNEAYHGGAVYFSGSGTVANCNFTDNEAYNGGAVYFSGSGTVANCNFADNSAVYGGGAIFSNNWYSVADTCIFKTESDTININVIIVSPTLNVDNFTTVYGSGEKLTFDLKTNSGIPVTNGNISISVYFKDNNSWVRNYSCLSGEGWAVSLPVGSYYANFTTEYAGFQAISRTITITIPNVRYYINVTSLATNNKTVNITAKSDIPKDILWNGKLLFILPNSTQINANYAGKGTWWAVHTFDDYAVYQVNASYDGLNNVTVSNAKITINKVDSTITLDNITLNYGESRNITVATQGAVGITADINGINVTVINNYTIQIADLAAGNYTLTVTTIPDGDHNPVTATSKITVNKIESTLTVNNVELDYGDSINVTVTALGATGITAKIDNDDAVVNGNVISIPFLDVGNYTLTVTTIADANHNNVTKTANITVNKVDSTLTVDNIVFDYNSTGSATVSYDGASGVNASVIDQPNAKVNVNGNTITVSNLNAGNYTLTVTTIADANHNNITKTATITVNKLKTELKAIAISTTYNINKDLVISLTDANGNPLSGVIIGVNLGSGKFTTDRNGQVKINVANLVPKTYTAKITFNGNTKYDKSTKDVKVTVTKATPKLTATKKTFKKSVKTKKYTVTLKTNLNKVMKGAKVTLKVKGKTYKATTNAKGKATFKIKNLKKKGKFTATVKFAGNAYYKAVTKKVKIIVK